MPTLFLLVALIVSSFFGGLSHLPAQADTRGGACISTPFDTSGPHILSDQDPPVECITIDGVTAAFSNTAPVHVDLKVSGKTWQDLSRRSHAARIDQWRDGNEIFVSIYRETATVAQAAPNPYDETVPLDGRFEAGSYTVHVNDTTIEIAIPDAPPPGSDAQPPSDHSNPQPAQGERHYAVIQNIDVIVRESYPARVALHITGYYQDNCVAATQIDQRRAGSWVYVEIYRVIDPRVRCRDARVPLDETIRLDGTFERGTYIIQVNDYVQQTAIPYPPPPPPPPEPIRSYAVIESVDVLVGETFAYPSRLTLHVTGYDSTGCRGQLQIDQWRSGNWVYVEIYRLVDPRIMCPDMLTRLDEYIPLNGTFDYGTYTFSVNDYTFRYLIPPGPVYDDQPKPR
jgi:hypothetical protein